MDWNDLRNQVSNISLYDVKAGIRKVQNAVMNYTEMEAKVREATNNEPWGASSTLMQEIANATFNYQLLNEIMPMIYKRFTEKSAEEWRQIYKALQLLEFLIKNGAERVIDDARAHLGLLRLLRQFHYIDENGKDQGVNVRNRSKELAELLGDVEKIRAERKKARATRNKYRGVEGGAGIGSSGGGRYGGFGNETVTSAYGSTFGGSTRAVYGDGGGFGGETDEYESSSRRGRAERFEEYDEFDDSGAQATPARRRTEMNSTPKSSKKAEVAKPKEPEVDLLGFGDEQVVPVSSTKAAASSTAASSTAVDDDDFDDFQSAPSQPAAALQAAPTIVKLPAPTLSAKLPAPSPSSSSVSSIPKANYSPFNPPSTAQKAPDFSNLFSATSPPASTGPGLLSPQTTKSTGSGFQPTGPNYFTSVSTGTSSASTPSANVMGGSGGISSTTAAKKPQTDGQDAFASLLSGVKKQTNNTKGAKVSLADMAKQKSQAALYGANASSSGSGGGGGGDLLG
ncbi:ENTH-domain-containing protein [Piedraia hortae CBS 480.64]|uniref:ENTH-domain-containing protein n=1 Tax=Piedraia hortae CBS 480.64 TaxID=1314780 RepID=A0A6A7BWA5_9PEZI|nr:ENTH-domain-containing protein [Piedraia hortae CBS 480.64]